MAVAVLARARRRSGRARPRQARVVLATALLAALSLLQSASAACQNALTVGGFHGHAYAPGTNTVSSFGEPRFELAPPSALAALPVLSVAAGGFHSCGLFANATAAAALNASNVGDVVCWGLGAAAVVPPSLAAAGPFVDVAAGGYAACAIRATANRSAVCWGDNTYGASTPPHAVTNPLLAGWSSVLSLGLGTYHGCAVMVGTGANPGNKSVLCWGRNDAGQVSGIPSSLRLGTAVPWYSLRVTCGGAHCCAAGKIQTGFVGGVALSAASTSLQCWGDAAASGGASVLPATLPGLSSTWAGTVTTVAAGGRFTCAALSGGGVACWGSNAKGAATPPPALALVSGYGTSQVSALACGWYGCCAVATSVVDLAAGPATTCWGSPFVNGSSSGSASSSVSVTTPAVTDAGGRSGAIVITSGDASSGGGNGGAVYLATGAASGGGSSGAVVVATGAVTSPGTTSGAVSVVTGAGGSIVIAPGQGGRTANASTTAPTAPVPGGAISLLASSAVANGVLAITGNLTLRSSSASSGGGVSLDAVTLAALLALIPSPTPTPAPSLVSRLYPTLFNVNNGLYSVAASPVAPTLYVATSNWVAAVNVSASLNTSVGTGGSSYLSCSAPALSSPYGLTLSDTGTTLFVGDAGNHMVRVFDLSQGVCGTMAGSGIARWVDGFAALASFNSPRGLTYGTVGGTPYVFVADYANHAIRRVSTVNGYVDTIAGNASTPGAVDAAAGVNASFLNPSDLAFHQSGELIVADAGNALIRVVIASAPFRVKTLAGTPGQRGLANGIPSAFRLPTGLTLLPSGTVAWVADSDNCCLRAVELQNGTVSPAVGTCAYGLGVCPGLADGVLLPPPPAGYSVASVSMPTRLVWHAGVNAAFVVSATGVQRIAGPPPPSATPSASPTPSSTPSATPSPSLSASSTPSASPSPTASGSPTPTASRSPSPTLTPSTPPPPPPLVTGVYPTLFSSSIAVYGMAVSPVAPALYVSTGGLILVANVSKALNTSGGSGSSSFLSCPTPSLSTPYGLVVSPTGSTLFVADTGNHRIRSIDLSGGLCTILAGSGTAKWVEGPGTAASFSSPRGVAYGTVGGTPYVFVADYANHAIRRVAVITSDVDTIAGNASTPGSVDAAAGVNASFLNPSDLAFHPASASLIVADAGNALIRIVVASPPFLVQTLAGTPGQRGLADGTPGVFNLPSGLTLLPSGNVAWVADTNNCCLRAVDLVNSTVAPAVGDCTYTLGSCPAQADGTLLPPAPPGYAAASVGAPMRVAWHAVVNAGFVMGAKMVQRIAGPPPPSATPSVTPTPSASATASASVSASPSVTPSASRSATKTRSITRSPSPTPSPAAALAVAANASDFGVVAAFADLTAATAVSPTLAIAALSSGALFAVPMGPNASAALELPAAIPPLASYYALLTDPEIGAMYLLDASNCGLSRMSIANILVAAAFTAAVTPYLVVGDSAAVCGHLPAEGRGLNVKLQGPFGMGFGPKPVISYGTDASTLVPFKRVVRTFYIADSSANQIRAVVCGDRVHPTTLAMQAAPDCNVTVLAGSMAGVSGFNASPTSASAALFSNPTDVAYYNMTNGNGPVVFVADSGNMALRAIQLSTGMVTTGYAGGSFTIRKLVIVEGVANPPIDALVLTYSADAGLRYFLQGGAAGGPVALTNGTAGFANGPAHLAQTGVNPNCLTWSAFGGGLLVCDPANFRLRLVSWGP